MADIIRTGGDLHYATAEMIYNKPRDEISKKERQIAKGLNFSLNC
jgi:DNA polymerase I-like protein with 3'-5' exonuclease and polymerase domains